jgi:hypothetical protein
MTKDQKLEALTKWQAVIEKADRVFDPIVDAIGLEPDGALFELVTDLQMERFNSPSNAMTPPNQSKETDMTHTKDEAFLEWYDNAHWGNEDFKEGCRRAWNAAIKQAPAPANLWLYWKVDDKGVVTGPFKTDSKGVAYGQHCIDQTQLTVPAAQPALPLTDDPLQGAVDWFLQADGEYFCTANVQRTLRIGYNRAKRLCDTAKERADHGITKGQP